MEGSGVGDGGSALLSHVIDKGRALPLAWRVHGCPKGHFPQALHIEVVELIRELIPEGSEVVFLGGGEWIPLQQNQLKAEAAPLAAEFQRSRFNVEGRNGYLSLRNHQLRGLDHTRRREGLTMVHNFFLARADGTTAAERFFEQKPRSMFAAILASVELPPAPLSPPRRAVG
jgi:hypothetical protein